MDSGHHLCSRDRLICKRRILGEKSYCANEKECPIYHYPSLRSSCLLDQRSSIGICFVNWDDWPYHQTDRFDENTSRCSCRVYIVDCTICGPEPCCPFHTNVCIFRRERPVSGHSSFRTCMLLIWVMVTMKHAPDFWKNFPVTCL